MDVDDDEQHQVSTRKRHHPGSASSDTATKTSLEILKLVETPNFEELCRRYPYFDAAFRQVQAIQHQRRNTKATFASCVTQEFTVALTRALLHSQFQLHLVAVPSHNLCPPVPNRLFYVHWIHTELLPRLAQGTHLARTQDGYASFRMPRFSFWGLDIGTGSSCVYPLLAARIMDAKTHLVATDIDREALTYAKQNVDGNDLSGKIKLIAVPPSQSQQNHQASLAQTDQSLQPPDMPSGPIFNSLQAWAAQLQAKDARLPGSATQPVSHFDFCMTNPPFYDVSEQAVTTAIRAGDGRARTSMTASEGTYPGGGEYGFVVDMIADSIVCAIPSRKNDPLHPFSSCLWYSSMLGKKTSVVRLQKLLICLFGPGHVVATEYGPGQYTRWFVAWTLLRPTASAPACRTVSHMTEWNGFAVPLASDAVNAVNRLPPFAPLPERSFSLDMSQVPENMEALVHRILDYCSTFLGCVELKTVVAPMNDGRTVSITVTESNPPSLTMFVDESEPNVMEMVPLIIQQSLQAAASASQGIFAQHQLLPSDGHFMIEITVELSPLGAGASSSAWVHLECYWHSSRGLRTIDKFRNGMSTEINRTNRKWRRTFKRMASSMTAPTLSIGGDAMEE